VISLFLVTLGLVSARSALRVAYLTAILVFISGIPGTPGKSLKASRALLIRGRGGLT
jgi:predicted ATPase with chaperone activity